MFCLSLELSFSIFDRHNNLNYARLFQLDKCVAVQSPPWSFIDSKPPPPPPSVGGEGAADVSARGDRSAESNDR